jgi:DNA primase
MDAVEDIKGRLAIEDVVGEYLELKRAGRNFKALSPFSNEKTPSLMISPEKQIWHDFSSGKGGDIFSFVMEMEGLDFKSTLELLARKAGVDLSLYGGNRPGNSQLKDRLYECTEKATKFYQTQFSKNQKAQGYVINQRKLNKKTILDFRIGYAPNTGDALLTYLKKQGFTSDELQKAGLITRYRNNERDMFRGRLMIPLADPQARIIGFTARQLQSAKDSPKYINTPATMIYDKSRHVFGLHLAKDSIRQAGYAVIVEGNMDVIASHQAGVRQTVATAGTALTSHHLKTINNFTNDLRLAFDQDDAGQNAVERATALATQQGVDLSVINLNDAKDPDEIIQKSPELWEKAIQSNVYAVDWLIKRYQAQFDISKAEGKRRFTDTILATVGKLSDMVERDHYITQIAKIVDVDVDSVRAKISSINEAQPKRRYKTNNVKKDPKNEAEKLKVQNRFLALLLQQPALRYHLKSCQEDMFLSSETRQLFVFLLNHQDLSNDPLKEADLRPIDNYVKILILQYEELYQGLELLELRNEAARLKSRVIEQYVKAQKNRLSFEINNADEKTQQKLLEQVRELDHLLRNAKG